MKATYLFKGLIKSIPGIEYIYEFNKNTGGTCDPAYCYSVWLRHLISAYESGLKTVPKIVAELGPGDSLGAGFAALISGSEKYYALDIKRYSNPDQNLKIFDALVLLFSQCANIPDQKEFPRLRPLLNSYSFPHYIINQKLLKENLKEERISKIRNEIMQIDDLTSSKQFIEYIIPWSNAQLIEKESVDMVFSQAVLQAVDDLENTYKKIALYLKPNGLQSHDIGFKSCGSADTWYGHWLYTDPEWKIVRGRKSFNINREPYSTHVNLLSGTNCEIILEKKDFAQSKIDKSKLSARFRNKPDDDFVTYSAFFQALKKE